MRTGGGAWGDMDDIYAVGPAAHVFPAIEAFSREVHDNLGLVLRPEKLECFSPSYDLERCPRGDGLGWLGGHAELGWWSTFAEWL